MGNPMNGTKKKSKHNQGKETIKNKWWGKKNNNQRATKKKYIACKNQFFHILLGPMGLGETLTIFFCVLGRDGKSNERHKKKQEQAQSRKRTQ